MRDDRLDRSVLRFAQLIVPVERRYWEVVRTTPGAQNKNFNVSAPTSS
jgi:hypothetical protein